MRIFTYVFFHIYKTMDPLQFYKCLADDTRLHILLLLTQVEEACVCDFISALELEQPKISRHLASLRQCGLLRDERRGKWVYYQIHNELPNWAKQVLTLSAVNNKPYFQNTLTRLKSAQTDANTCK